MRSSVLNKSRQKGITAGGWLLILSLVGFFVLLTLRLFPLYYNHFKIRGVVESFTEESELYDMPRSRLLSIISKRLNISFAEGFKPEHLVIVLKSSGRKEIHIKYEDCRPILGDLDVIASFDDYVTVFRNGKSNLNSNAVQRLEKNLGYHFLNLDNLEQALSHRSVGNHHYERLEFLGDSILGFIVADEIYRRFPDASEGQMTRLRSNLVKGKTLAILAKKFSIGEFLILGSGEMKSGGHRRDSILADAFESILAAMYLEAGLEVCRERLICWYGDVLSKADPTDISKDSKTLLQERMQSLKLPLPKYTVIKITGKDHQRSFDVQCECEGNNYSQASTAIGIASNRRDAEKIAAEKILFNLDKILQ